MSNDFMQMYNDRTIQLMEVEGKLEKALDENERLNRALDVESQDFKQLCEVWERLQTENERLKQNLIDSKATASELLRSFEKTAKELMRFKDKYESTPERALKSILEFHKAPLAVSTTCDGGGRRVNLILGDKLLLSEYRNGIDDTATLTAEDIEE